MRNNTTYAPKGCHGETHVWDCSVNSTTTDTTVYPYSTQLCMCRTLTWEHARLRAEKNAMRHATLFWPYAFSEGADG